MATIRVVQAEDTEGGKKEYEGCLEGVKEEDVDEEFNEILLRYELGINADNGVYTIVMGFHIMNKHTTPWRNISDFLMKSGRAQFSCVLGGYAQLGGS